MLSLPLAIVGALLAILLTGNNLGMPAMIGVVMLMGLVTKNAILLIDTTNQYVREGKSVEDAILTAGPIRLRPILMTTMAMILGMLPSALGRGEGGEFRAPISIATIGGLITSTALTLVVVPVAYLLLARVPRRGCARGAPIRRAAAPRGARHRRAAARRAGRDGSSRPRARWHRQPIPGQPEGWPSTGQCGLGSARPALTLTFDDALARALSSNESAEGGPGTGAREPGAGRRRRRPSFLPTVEHELPVHAGAAVSVDPDSRPASSDPTSRRSRPASRAATSCRSR